MKRCPKCGYLNGDNTEFCEECSQKIARGRFGLSDVRDSLRGAVGELFDGTIQLSETYSKDGTGVSNGDFISSDETVQAIIGTGYVKNFLSSSSIKCGVATLTEKRLYYAGKSFLGKGTSAALSTEEAIIPLEDISSTKFIHKNSIAKLVLGIYFVLVSFFLMRTYGAAGIFSLLLGGAFLVWYYFSRTTVFEIAFPGGKYCFDARWHSISSMQKFQRQIHLAKDRLKVSESTNTGERMEGPQ